MGKELLPVLVSGIISFFAFWCLGSFINREFNLEDIPVWIQTGLSIIVMLILFLKRDLFFKGPISSGASIGFILAILWNIKDSVFMSRFFRTVFSLRFILLLCITALGILRKNIMTGIWDRYLINVSSGMKTFLIVLVAAVYIFGAVLLLNYGAYRNGKKKYSQFSMHKRASRHRGVIGFIAGIVMIFISSTFFREAIFSVMQNPK